MCHLGVFMRCSFGLMITAAPVPTLQKLAQHIQYFAQESSVP